MHLVVGLGCAAAGAVAGVLAGSAAHGGTDLPAAGGRCVAPGSLRDGVALGILSGVPAGLVGARLGASLALPAFWGSAALSGPLAVADFLRHRLPHTLVMPLYVIGGVALVVTAVSLGTVGSLARAVGAAAAVTAVFLALALGFPGQLGLGDVVMVGALTLSLGWLGWQQVIVGLMASSLLGARA